MRKRRQFTNEFKLEAVKLVERGDVPVAQVARDLDLHEAVLRRWIQRFGKRPNGARLTPDEHEELIQLRREVRRVTEERGTTSSRRPTSTESRRRWRQVRAERRVSEKAS